MDSLADAFSIDDAGGIKVTLSSLGRLHCAVSSRRQLIEQYGHVCFKSPWGRFISMGNHSSEDSADIRRCVKHQNRRHLRNTIQSLDHSVEHSTHGKDIRIPQRRLRYLMSTNQKSHPPRRVYSDEKRFSVACRPVKRRDPLRVWQLRQWMPTDLDHLWLHYLSKEDGKSSATKFTTFKRLQGKVDVYRQEERLLNAEYTCPTLWRYLLGDLVLLCHEYYYSTTPFIDVVCISKSHTLLYIGIDQVHVDRKTCSRFVQMYSGYFIK